MSTIVIGGHTRSVGKTSVVAGLIAALPEFHWTALKVTQYGHGICSANGALCDCATGDHSWAVTEEKRTEEKQPSGATDTSRFLAAGADHSWWVRTEQGRLAEAMPRVRAILAAAPNVIIESNSVLRFLKPDLYITVLDPATEDFKSSAQQFLDRADAVLLHTEKSESREPRTEGQKPEFESRAPKGESRSSHPTWKQVSLKPVLNRPTFEIHPPHYVTPEIVAFIRARLASLAANSQTTNAQYPSKNN
jgi:hypothetical protein